MTAKVLDSLTHRYTQKADFHGLEAIFGDKKYREYHEKQERMYDRLLIKLTNLYLEEYGKSN